MSTKITETLKFMAEIAGRNLSLAAARMMAADLANYPEFTVLSALETCRRELARFPTIADIISRIDDGRPGVEAAWAMIPKDEQTSVVWTEEMSEAFSDCRHLIGEDQIAARMAFKESYEKQLRAARAQRKPVRWSLSMGHDKAGREAAVVEAFAKNRISGPEARAMLPNIERGAHFIAFDGKTYSTLITSDQDSVDAIRRLSHSSLKEIQK